MESVTTGKRRRKVVVKKSPSGLEDIRRKLDPLPKINGKVYLGNLTHDAHSRAVHVDATKVTPAVVSPSETSSLWIPLNGSERDALSTLIPHQIPHQGNGAHPSASAATAEADKAPAKLTDTLAGASVVHAIRGRSDCGCRRVRPRPAWPNRCSGFSGTSQV
jgi:hypothetical protein